jgi:hypothetical protein
MDSCEGIDSFYLFRSPFVWSDYGKDDFIGILAAESLPRFLRLGFLLSFPVSFFSDVVGLCTVNLGEMVFSREMPFLATIEIFSFFL